MKLLFLTLCKSWMLFFLGENNIILSMQHLKRVHVRIEILFEFSQLDDVYYDIYTLLNTTLQGSYGVPPTTLTSVVKSNQKTVKIYFESHLNVCYFTIFIYLYLSFGVGQRFKAC